MIISASKACGIAIQDLYHFYGLVSNIIHGIPWSGPAILMTSALSDKQKCFIKNLADFINFPVMITPSEANDLTEGK